MPTELRNCELYDYQGEPLEHDGCDECGQCLVCWYCECDSYEEAIEHHIDKCLEPRQAPVRLEGGRIVG